MQERRASTSNEDSDVLVRLFKSGETPIRTHSAFPSEVLADVVYEPQIFLVDDLPSKATAYR